jgi:hypothetical protein
MTEPGTTVVFSGTLEPCPDCEAIFGTAIMHAPGACARVRSHMTEPGTLPEGIELTNSLKSRIAAEVSAFTWNGASGRKFDSRVQEFAERIAAFAQAEGHGDGQRHTIEDVNAGRVDDLIRPRLDAARAEGAAQERARLNEAMADLEKSRPDEVQDVLSDLRALLATRTPPPPEAWDDGEPAANEDGDFTHHG